MTGQDFTKAIACLLAWREERSNGINGMSAVLFVVRNRAKAGWNGGDWNKVIESHNQFSSISVIGDSQTIAYPDIRDPEFMKLMNVVDSIYEDLVPDNLTDGSLYYADLNSKAYHKGGWFDVNIVGKAEEHPRLAVVGSTTYFK